MKFAQILCFNNINHPYCSPFIFLTYRGSKHIETFFTGCKDNEFINLSSVDNRAQFEYFMNAFDQELYNKDILDSMNLYDMDESKLKMLQYKFNSKFKERKRVSDADVQFFDLGDSDQGQTQKNPIDPKPSGDEGLAGNVEPDLDKCRSILAQDHLLRYAKLKLFQHILKVYYIGALKSR